MDALLGKHRIVKAESRITSDPFLLPDSSERDINTTEILGRRITLPQPAASPLLSQKVHRGMFLLLHFCCSSKHYSLDWGVRGRKGREGLQHWEFDNIFQYSGNSHLDHKGAGWWSLFWELCWDEHCKNNEVSTILLARFARLFYLVLNDSLFVPLVTKIP